MKHLFFEQHNEQSNMLGQKMRNEYFDVDQGVNIEWKSNEQNILRNLFSKRTEDSGIINNVESFEKIGNDVANALKNQHPEVKYSYDLSRVFGANYYDGVCFKIMVTNKQGEEFQLVDGGFTDWTQLFLSDKKERFLGSGLGTEFLIRKFS